MPLATRRPGPAIHATLAVVPASVDSEIEVVAQGSEAGPSSLHEKTLPMPGKAVHAAGTTTPASMLSAVAKLSAANVLTHATDDKERRLERKKSNLYGFHEYDEHSKGSAGREISISRRSKERSEASEASSARTTSSESSAGVRRIPAASTLPAVSFANRLRARSRRSRGSTGTTSSGKVEEVRV